MDTNTQANQETPNTGHPDEPKPKKVSRTIRNKKIKALKIAGVTERDIAQRFDLSPAGVHKVIANTFTPAELAEFRNLEPNLLAQKRYEIIKSIGEQDIQKASLMQKAASYGVFFDKQALLEGRATSISDVDIRAVLAMVQSNVDTK